VITELGIGNFKAFGETQRVPIKPLTLIFGANSSGKSSILHSLLLAHHGMETGEYDVRQTKLAGDMVDLGGFRSYVHKHDSSKTVRMQLETDIDHQALMEHLDGDAKEKAPFLKLSRFGLSLTVAGGDGLLAEAQREDWRTDLLRVLGQEACLARITVLFDGQEVLTFLQDVPGLSRLPFRAQAPSGSGSFLGQLIRCLAELSRAGDAREYGAKSSGYHDLPQEEQTAGAQALKETAEGSPKRPASAEPSIESDLARLKQAFAEAITQDTFSFDRFVLRDYGYGHPTTRPSAKWSIERGECDGLLDFYREYTSVWEPRPWWAEAQAVRHNLSNLIEYCTARIADVLRRVAYLGPLRCVPARYASLEGAVDARALASGGAAWDEIRRNPRVLEAVNRWLGTERLRTPYILKSLPFLDADRLRIALRGYEASAESLVEKLAESPDSSVLVFEDANAGTTVSHRDIGFGVSQVLPVLVNAAAMRERLIAIEQPELHLHPAQQAELGDVFIESALGERKNTFLLETHSEHLILRVMRRIRETAQGRLPPGAVSIRPTDVAVLYVERDGDHSIVREMPLNERGELVKAWPGGFFEEGYRELFS
jgi:hypothetical protein